jgi:hypothetical protein
MRRAFCADCNSMRPFGCALALVIAVFDGAQRAYVAARAIIDATTSRLRSHRFVRPSKTRRCAFHLFVR